MYHGPCLTVLRYCNVIECGEQSLHAIPGSSTPLVSRRFMDHDVPQSTGSGRYVTTAKDQYRCQPSPSIRLGLLVVDSCTNDS